MPMSLIVRLAVIAAPPNPSIPRSGRTLAVARSGAAKRKRQGGLKNAAGDKAADFES
jgi:hypothetical protein